jgi:hypothetical protein
MSGGTRLAGARPLDGRVRAHARGGNVTSSLAQRWLSSLQLLPWLRERFEHSCSRRAAATGAFHRTILLPDLDSSRLHVEEEPRLALETRRSHLRAHVAAGSLQPAARGIASRSALLCCDFSIRSRPRTMPLSRLECVRHTPSLEFRHSLRRKVSRAVLQPPLFGLRHRRKTYHERCKYAKHSQMCPNV